MSVQRQPLHPVSSAVSRVAALGVLLLVSFVAGGCSGGGSGSESQGSSSIDGRSRSVGDCAVKYSLVTLADRSWAFDGTIVAFGKDGVVSGGGDRVATFRVLRWYRGGSASETTVRFTFPTENLDSAEARDAKVGERFLVAGSYSVGSFSSYPVAFGCGFTQRWTEYVAQQWATAIGS
jgi:hypothetical protein